MTVVVNCQFCGLQIGAQQFCPARTLIPGERFPCEPSTPGTRMVDQISRRIKVRSVFGSSKKRR